ncbi:alpha/beta-hydrolase [Delitschia confertaspora ATCC 74209]|uniref:Alpha/beta-hydrolase n=1 Tax=Delitschia confertaspora ATCC 74209 TaxID=1513339 RepID=A0A9P4MNQ2_9PLEO|nr:alpha/beta-hydrolase [Delitschia confertaspora ATCC 74209]
MPIEIDDQGRTYIHHPSGQRTHYILNSFVDPWKPHDTILIQHGFGRHAGFWYHWIPVLSRHYHVIRRDLRGHGYSSYPTGKEVEVYKYNLDTILREIVDTLDQLGVRKVHFLGESTGGMLGEALAAKYPDRLLSLTVCSTPTHLPSPALKMFAFDKKDWPTACRELGSRGWAEALSKLPGTIPIEDPAYLPWYLDQIAISDGEGLAQYAEFLAHLDTRPFLPWIKLPMLILAPSNSAATRLEEQQKLLSQVPNARMEVISGKGHEIYVTEAEICQYVFLSFLAELAEEGWERRLREEQEGLERRLSGERDKMQKRRSGQQEKLHSAMNGEERAKGMVGAEKERKDSLGVMGQ